MKGSYVKKIFLIMMLIGVLGFGFSCGFDDEPMVWPEYVQHTGFNVNSNTIYWIDNDRLIFSLYVGERVELDKNDPNESGMRRAIWNHKTGEMDIAPYQMAGPMCVKLTKNEAGKITEQRVWYSTFSSKVEMAGVPGEEALYEPRVRMDNEHTDMGLMSKYRCDQLEAHETIKGRFVEGLRKGDGYISDPNGPFSMADVVILYHKDIHDPGTPTPFQGHNGDMFASHKSSSFIDFKADTPREGDLRSVYYFGDSGFRKKGYDGPEDCMPVYWFWPRQAEFKKVCLPWNSNWSNIVPTQLGYVMHQQMFNTREIFTSGVYLLLYGDTPFDVTRMVKLAHGMTYGRIATSPDGCKIAWRHIPKFGSHKSKKTLNQVDLKIIDLCKHTDVIRALPTTPPLRVHPVK